MKITIAAIGKAKSSDATSKLFAEYLKRIPWKSDLIELEEKKPLPDNILKEKEAKKLLQTAPKGGKIIALDERGKNISSRELANKIESWQDEGASNITFLIGGAAGHGEEVRKEADLLLSFGKLTWPHMMVRSMLAEQIYRISTILSGHPYHKD